MARLSTDVVDRRREEESHRRAIMTSLEQGSLPVRFMYSDSAAEKHIRFAEEFGEEYLDGRFEHEVSALSQFLGTDNTPPQLCDIGPSNGVHTAQFMDWYVTSGGGRDHRYLGLDLSQRLLDAARARLSPYTRVERSFARWDMESAPTGIIESWRTHGKALVCLFGNTLGNVEDPARVLRNIFHSCRVGDYFILGVFGLPPPGRDDAESYASEPIHEMILEPLRTVGLSDSSLDLRIELVNETVVGTVRLTRPVTIAGTRFPQGHEIRCFLSRRHRLENTRELLFRTGWYPVGTSTDADGGHLVLIGERMREVPRSGTGRASGDIRT